MLHQRDLTQQTLAQRIEQHHHVTEADIQRLVRRDYMWMSRETHEILKQINQPQKYRIQAALLKLGGGDFKKLTSYMDMAQMDPISFLFLAEYPNFFHIENTTSEKRDLSISKDWFSYIQWLTRK